MLYLNAFFFFSIKYITYIVYSLLEKWYFVLTNFIVYEWKKKSIIDYSRLNGIFPIDCLSKSYYSLLRSILSTILFFLSKCIGHLVEYLFIMIIYRKKIVYEYRFAMKRNYCKYTYIYISCDNDMWKYSSVLVFFLSIIIKVKFRFEWIIFNWMYKYLFLEE